jgi:hypothetical protein
LERGANQLIYIKTTLSSHLGESLQRGGKKVNILLTLSLTGS